MSFTQAERGGPTGVVACAVLRANPAYELVLVDRLSAGEHEALAGEPDLYGALRPRPGSGLRLRAASPEDARLFLALGEPGEVPGDARVHCGADVERRIARLLLDGVLEVEHRGAFVSGTRAGELALGPGGSAGQGRVGELSLAALQYGQALAACGVGVEQLTDRLHAYGRRPVTSLLRARFGEPTAISRRLEAGRLGQTRMMLRAGWIETTAPACDGVPRRSWRSRKTSASGRSGAYTLYISPDAALLDAAFGAVVGLVGPRGPIAISVACDIAGICRPDKLVASFDRLVDVHASARRLSAELDGAGAHGVPFSAALTDDGLLSWGPESAHDHVAGAGWRRRLSRQLAEHLLAGGGEELEPWQFALREIHRDGVDTDTWAPANGMWEEALA